MIDILKMCSGTFDERKVVDEEDALVAGSFDTPEEEGDSWEKVERAIWPESSPLIVLY